MSGKIIIKSQKNVKKLATEFYDQYTSEFTYEGNFDKDKMTNALRTKWPKLFRLIEAHNPETKTITVYFCDTSRFYD